MSRSAPQHRPFAALTLLLCSALAQAQQAQGPQQIVKPARAQAWIDVATFSGMGMPGMGGMAGGGGSPMAAALGGLFGGGSSGEGRNSFGQTQGASTGRWVDVTVASRANPQMGEALQQVPAGFMASALKLQAPKDAPRAALEQPDDKEIETTYERPKGRLLLYWGCGSTVREGQPRVLDMATATPADLAKFFVSRRATQRGAHSAPGRPLWPSREDSRMLPAQASLVGEHSFSGQGLPENFRFQIPAAQDLMPALQLTQRSLDGGATELSWNALPNARAYFAAAMGGNGDGASEMVIWTSSELPDNGFGLIDYQTNAAVDRWLKEQVLLPPSTTRCSVPKGVFKGEGGAMLRLIAHGSELNLAHPPRPSDRKIPWEPDWTLKLRVKAVASAMLGMEMGATGLPGRDAADASQETDDKPAEKEKKLRPADLLKGLFGR